jgi:hypothetical protein
MQLAQCLTRGKRRTSNFLRKNLKTLLLQGAFQCVITTTPAEPFNIVTVKMALCKYYFQFIIHSVKCRYRDQLNYDQAYFFDPHLYSHSPHAQIRFDLICKSNLPRRQLWVQVGTSAGYSLSYCSASHIVLQISTEPLRQTRMSSVNEWPLLKDQRTNLFNKLTVDQTITEYDQTTNRPLLSTLARWPKTAQWIETSTFLPNTTIINT